MSSSCLLHVHTNIHFDDYRSESKTLNSLSLNTYLVTMLKNPCKVFICFTYELYFKLHYFLRRAARYSVWPNFKIFASSSLVHLNTTIGERCVLSVF